MCKDCTVETITAVFSTTVLVQIVPFRHHDKKYYSRITGNDGAAIHRCGHQPSLEEAINDHSSLYNNHSRRGGGGVMRAPRLLSGASTRETMRRALQPYTRIPDTEDDSDDIHCCGRRTSSTSDEIGGRGKQGWLMEASKGGGG
jgi:hypothetical protein